MDECSERHLGWFRVGWGRVGRCREGWSRAGRNGSDKVCPW